LCEERRDEDRWGRHLDALDDGRALLVQLRGIPVVRFLLALLRFCQPGFLRNRNTQFFQIKAYEPPPRRTPPKELERGILVQLRPTITTDAI